jgi:membrane fusion protein, copper/silver efflux system
MKKTLTLLLLAAALFAAIGYWIGARRQQPQAEQPAQATPAAARKVLYWYDPMYPQHKFDKPGKSPFMDMQLVPKYADEGSDAGTVSISPRMVQNLGVRTAEASSGSIEQRFETTGAVGYNERAVVQLQARAAGFVEKVHARAPLDPVEKGAPLVDILFPEWAGAQEEFLLLRRSDAAELQALARAARQRLVLLGMTEAQIVAIEREGRIRTRFTLAAPISGVIAELGVREGSTVTPGQTLYRIVDLSTVWVTADIAEAQASWVRPHARVEARVPAYPDRVFSGRVGALLPEVSAATRTVRARIELDNPGARLKPGMFATLEFTSGAPRKSILVPSEAVIRTGTRDFVIVALGEGRFRPVPVEVGFESGAQSEIRKGLRPGDRVVLSGQFLIDSEASLSATVARLEGSQLLHKGRAKVSKLDVENGRVELDHEAIASLHWPEMRMGFVTEDKGQLSGIKTGDAVEFEFEGEPNKDGDYVIRRIAPQRKR